MQKSPLLPYTYITYFLSVVRAFSVTVGTPTQCDDLPVSWTGGQAPFQIIVTPFAPSQCLRNISVPVSAFSNGKGSYSIPQFPFKNGTQFLLTMSDATGFGSGGTSTILNVGAPVANNNCNTTVQSPDFFFSTPLELQQCNDYVFDAYSGAVFPATITGLIPGGEHIVLFPVMDPNYTWIADVESGTNLIFFMMDSQGRQGGVSPLNTVHPLSNTSCINVNSPSSTASAPSQTSGQNSSSGSKASTVGIIAGSTVGGVVLIVLLIILGIWCIRKTSRKSGRKDDDHEVRQNFPSQYQTDHGSHLPLMQPGSLSHLSAGDPVTQHLRQMSYTDSFAGSSSISSASRPMTVLGGQTASPNSFTHQALPVGLAAPVHPGTHSHNTSASNFAINDPYAPLSQIQPSRVSSNLDSITEYGDAGISSISSTSRQMAAMAGQRTSPSYPFPYQTHPAPPVQPRTRSHHASASSFTISTHPSSSPTLPSRLSSNIDGGSLSMSSPGVRMATATGQVITNPSPHVLVHTDIEDIPAPPGAQDLIELPPQYTDRQHLDSQPASAPTQKSLQF